MRDELVRDELATLIFLGGILQLCVLIASALVPVRLDWRNAFAVLPRLHRQMYWVYGGYVVLGIIANGLLCLFNSTELAAGSRLAQRVRLHRRLLGHSPVAASGA